MDKYAVSKCNYCKKRDNCETLKELTKTASAEAVNNCTDFVKEK